MGHIRNVHNKANIQCPGCKFSAIDKAKLIHHFRLQHFGYKQYGCKQCDKRFPRLTNVKYHILRVHDGKGNMDGKLRTQISESYWDGRDVIENHKHTHPESYPNDNDVMDAIERGRKDKIIQQAQAGAEAERLD